MKNLKTVIATLAIVYLTASILTATDIQDNFRRIGNLILKDTLSGKLITDNAILRQDLWVKDSLRVSGQSVFDNNVHITDGGTVYMGNPEVGAIGISGQIDYLYYYGTNHEFYSANNTKHLVTIDTADGLKSQSWVRLGPNAPVEAVKLLRFKVGNSNSSTTINHGLDHNTIIGWTCEIRDDTTNTHVNPASWYAPWSFYAKVDSLTVTITIPASPSGTSVANDSAFFRIMYRK